MSDTAELQKRKQKAIAYMKAGYTEHFISKYRKEHVGNVTPDELRKWMLEVTIDEDKSNPEYEEIYGLLDQIKNDLNSRG